MKINVICLTSNLNKLDYVDLNIESKHIYDVYKNQTFHLFHILTSEIKDEYLVKTYYFQNLNRFFFISFIS